MKNAKRILSGILALVMVLMLCPVIALAEETTDVTVDIAAMANGSVTADKDRYQIGDTVTLTVAPAAGYAQKLTINGEPLLLDWKTGTYSFVAAENKYVIAGSFEPTLAIGTADKWDTANQAQGVLNTYYTSGDSGWLGIDSNSESITVKAKNYLLGTDGTGVNDFFTLLGFKINNKNYTFRVIKQGGKYYCQRAGFTKPEGGNDWAKKELDAAAIEKILNDGVDFKLERIAADRLAVYVNGVMMDSYTMSGVTAAHAVTKIYIGHDGNDGEKVAIPFKIANPVFRVTGGSWNLDEQYDGSITILNKTKDGSTVITNDKDYKGVSVIVKDYTPSKNEDGSLKQGGFGMQVSFIFDNGKQYQVRLHNTDKDGNYKLQNMGGDNSITGWKWQADLTAAQKAKLLDGDGVEFAVKLAGANAELYVDGKLMKTVELGPEYDGKLAQIQLCMNGNKNGQNIVIPYALEKPHDHIAAEAVKENNVDATCSADGSYDLVSYCAICGEKMSTETVPVPATGVHTYDDDQDADCNVCGAVREVGPLTDANLKFAMAPGLSFQDYIGVQIFFKNSTGKNYDRVYAIAVQKDPTEGDVTTELGSFAYAGTYTVFEHKVMAWSMAESVTITLYGEKDGKVYQGQVIETSVEALALAKIADYASKNNAQACTALVDMLNYGKAVQVRHNHNADACPEVGEYAIYATTDAPEFTAENVITTTGTKASSNSVSMRDKVEIQLMFKASFMEGKTCVATLNGEEVAVEYTPYSSFIICRVAVGASQMRDTFKIAVYDADGNAASYVYEVSVEAYGKAQLGTDNNDVVIAMMKYGDAVAAIG